MIHTLKGSSNFIQSLKAKTATFMLALSQSNTVLIEGITQAGIPGLLHLTPALDAEFLSTGSVFSIKDIAKTPKGVPTPALMTRATHLLAPFDELVMLNLGLDVAPLHVKSVSFGLQPSHRIDEGARIDAHDLFYKGVQFAQTYECHTDYIILAESVPSGTTTALATALALGYPCENMFSSSFKESPTNIKKEVVAKALAHVVSDDSLWDTLGKVSDNMLIFNAGFLWGMQERHIPLILGGGTQMACVLLIVNAIAQELKTPFKSEQIALCTTSWVANDPMSDIEGLLNLLEFPINAYFSDFTFALSEHLALKLYDQGEAKEGVGAGASLVYSELQGITPLAMTREVERLLG